MKRKAGGFPVYIHPDGEISVCLFLSNDPEYGGDLPQLPKGHIDKGEGTNTAAARETQEETGIPLDALKKDYRLVTVRPFRGEASRYMMYVYAFFVDKKYPAKKNNEGRGLWLPLKKAKKIMRKDQRIFLKDLAEFIRDER